MTDTDVLVVGGGATGVGVARDFALRGVDVTLCERGGLGAGTTGRSHGLLHSGGRYATADPESARHCIAENRILREIAGVAIEETGGLFVRLPEDDPKHLSNRLAACRDLDIPAEELTPAEARAIEPELPSDIEGAICVPDGVIYPSRLVAATAESAIQHGATVRTHDPIEDVLLDDGAVVGVETATERLRADHVVNAAGAWAGRIAALADIEVPMAPTKGVMVAVDVAGVETVVNRCRPPGDGDIVVPHEDRVVVGTTSSAVDDPDEYSRPEAEIERMLTEGAALLPAVADAELEDVYWGVRPLYDSGADGRAASRTFQVFEHTKEGRPGMTTVTGGKLTTYRLMAEAVADAVCDRLGIDEPCRTAEESLPASDSATVDELVAAFDAENPADADVVGR